MILTGYYEKRPPHPNYVLILAQVYGRYGAPNVTLIGLDRRGKMVDRL